MSVCSRVLWVTLILGSALTLLVRNASETSLCSQAHSFSNSHISRFSFLPSSPPAGFVFLSVALRFLPVFLGTLPSPGAARKTFPPPLLLSSLLIFQHNQDILIIHVHFTRTL